MTEIFPFPTPTPTPKEVQVANGLLLAMNQELQHRINIHTQNFEYLWKRGEGEPTADQILSAMGSSAGTFILVARESLEHLATLAALVGKTLNDFISPANYEPPAEITVNPDGTVELVWPEPPAPPDPEPPPEE
jgi:hypothetical protein